MVKLSASLPMVTILGIPNKGVLESLGLDNFWLECDDDSNRTVCKSERGQVVLSWQLSIRSALTWRFAFVEQLIRNQQPLWLSRGGNSEAMSTGSYGLSSHCSSSMSAAVCLKRGACLFSRRNVPMVLGRPLIRQVFAPSGWPWCQTCRFCIRWR